MKKNYSEIKRIKLFLILTLVGILLFLNPATFAQNKPNILFIMTDQQSYDMMSCMGAEGLHTPNLDKLAERGYRFNKTYVANPVCMPSRFSLMTGRYSSDVDVRQNLQTWSREKLPGIIDKYAMGNVFRTAGYETLYSGKIHLYGTKDVSEYGFSLDGDDPYEGPTLFAEKTFAEKSKSKLKKPFLMFLSYLNPHDICYKAGMDGRFPGNLSQDRAAATIRYLAMKEEMSKEEYEKELIPFPENWNPIPGEVPEMVTPGLSSRQWTDEEWYLYNWMYNRLTESVDSMIGRVLTALNKSGLEENTVVVFTSDHGEMNGTHRLILKNVMFEEAQRVPFIFAGKGIRHKVDDETLVCNGLDLMPTLCDLTGVETPDGLPGISLKSYLFGTGTIPQRKYIITESYNSYQITDGQYKYTIYELPGNPETLVDIKNDPGETMNHTKDKSFENIKSTLKKELMQDLKQRGLPLLSDRTWKRIKAENKEFVNQLRKQRK